MADAHDPYAALRLRDYRRLLAAGVLASLGAEVQAAVVGWEIYARTQRYWCLGLVGLVQFLPVLLLALPAGQIADRCNRKYLLAAALSVMSAVGASLAVLSALSGPVEPAGARVSGAEDLPPLSLLSGSLPVIYLLLALTGAARAFSIPARWSLLPQVVPTETLRNAVAWNSSGWQLATISGPAFAGWAMHQLGAAGAYGLAAACQLIGIGLVLSLRLSAAKVIVDPAGAETRRLQNWFAGAAFIWRTKPILAALTLDLFAVLLGGATALLPAFCRDILDVQEIGYGWLRAAPSVGALTMALALAHRPLRRPGAALIVAVAGFGAATILFGISTNYVVSWIALALTGAFDNISVVVRGTLIQTLTPDEMRGRVASVNGVFISSSNELGALESGYAAHFLGPVLAVVLGGAGTLLVVAAALRIWPELWRLPAHENSPAA